MRVTAIFAALALITTGAGPAVELAPAAAVAVPIQTCALSGWSIDRDPAGLRVRAGPSARAAVVGRLPSFVVPKDDSAFGPVFEITGSKDGWLRIAEANDNYNNDTPRPTYAGTGWVHGSMVRVAVQGTTGREAPIASARVLVSTAPDWLSEKARVTAVTGCQGKWGKVRYLLNKPPRQGPRAGEAWFTGICGEQRTTCDGVGEGR